MRRASLLAAIASLALAVPAVAGASVAAAPGEVVFVGTRAAQGKSLVRGVRSDGTQLRTLPLGERKRAWWSPDGTRVVVMRTKLSIVNADGSGTVVLRVSCAGRCDVAWSADGKRIAYTVVEACSSPPCGSYLATIRANGSDRKVLLRFRGAAVESPAWSPDGRTIAFIEEASGIQDLNRVGANGRGFTRLSPADGGEYAPGYRPVWTPDSKRILFSAKRGGVQRVLSIHRSGSDLQTLAAGWWPVVSPSGKQVAFVSGNDIGYVAPLAGGTAKLVARRVDSPFVWSPDGAELAYLGADTRVHVAAANGKQRRAITDAYARLGSLGWRP